MAFRALLIAYQPPGHGGESFVREVVDICLTLILQGLDALMQALETWKGGVILISHDERFITKAASEVSMTRGKVHVVHDLVSFRQLWVCADSTVKKYYGDVQEYKRLIVSNIKSKP